MKRAFLFIGLGILAVLMAGFYVYFSEHGKKDTEAPLQQAVNHDKKTNELINLSTPEKTLESYMNCLRRGDRQGAIECFGGSGFFLSKPIPIKEYRITKRSVYSEARIDDLIAKGLMPSPPFHAGDVEFEVKVIYAAGESEGPVPYIDGQTEMYTYDLRLIGDKWILVALSAWDQD